MGGPGSRSYPNEGNGAGRKPKAAISVVGTGVPEMPSGLSAEVQKEWHRLLALTSGVTFAQDADVLLEASRLVVRQRNLNAQMDERPDDMELLGKSLAVGRALMLVLGKLGLTPRDRQSLLIPRKEEQVQKSRLEQIRERRSSN